MKVLDAKKLAILDWIIEKYIIIITILAVIILFMKVNSKLNKVNCKS